MKTRKLLTLFTLVIAATFLVNCGDDDDVPTSLVNFGEAAYDVDGITLEPITVSLELQPAAAEATSITIDFAGGQGAFTTTPALSGTSLELPVASGDETVSFTMEFNRDNLPSENFQVEMSLGELGPNLNSGITPSANVNVPFIDLQTIPYSEDFGGTGETCDDIDTPPAGWTIETVIGDPNSAASWVCITGAEGAFVHTGAGLAANAFNAGTASETWLISPVLGPITSTTTMAAGLDLRFDPFGGFPYEVDVLVSTDYNGLNFETANWERFQAGYDAWYSNDFEVDDVTIYDGLDLSAYEGEAISVAFVYICPDAGGGCGLARFDDFAIAN